jgi:molybdate transport system regulatory protein
MNTRKPKPRPRTQSARSLAVSGGLWLDSKGRSFLGGKRIALLEAIAEHGSITHAAKAVSLSYKGAWDMVDAMNNLAEKPLVTRGAGGAHGGGTQLTDYGKQVIALYRQLEAGHQKVITHMADKLHDADKLNELIKAIGMKSSARNQLRGVIKTVRKGAVNADVILHLGEGLEIFANITNAAVLDLGLKKGREAMALIKSSFVLLTTDLNPRISARNRLRGKITAITHGAVNSEVKLELPGGRTLVAIVTDDGVKELGLKTGMPCCAIIKASHVLIAVND